MSDNDNGPKLVDVAQLAGCSPTTVSRVLNNQPFVRPDVRERVLKAAQALGYVPNGSARALRSTRSRIVGIVIPTLKNAIYATMVDALEIRLSQDGVSLIIATCSYNLQSEYSQVKTLVERGAEAIVLVGCQHLKETMSLLEANRILCVYTYTYESNGIAAAVGFNNLQAARTAAEFLYGYGHRSIGMIAGVTEDNDRARDRRDGFLQALSELGLPRKSIPVVEAPYSLEAGFAAMRALMRRPKPPTAVFCGSDTLAAGAVKYCNQHEIKVPGDVSILGFDNLEIAELTVPELSTVEVPAEEMGILTAEYVLAPPKQREFMRHRELKTRLIVRNSTGPAQQALYAAG
jgi:LacI family transcriptional regulator